MWEPSLKGRFRDADEFLGIWGYYNYGSVCEAEAKFLSLRMNKMTVQIDRIAFIWILHNDFEI